MSTLIHDNLSWYECLLYEDWTNNSLNSYSSVRAYSPEDAANNYVATSYHPIGSSLNEIVVVMDAKSQMHFVSVIV